ncbi:polymer-forming cytoskeletal protein [Roseisolibacter sp. H3M3-2]|uniref:polymer-forming cytoskeletal protein n=1 Tax=Roseisolibacter sp. H3M3-2 TaxID=3031323 RepID=UPI0023DA287A|nr:polymer-forming cytoskeletal protein [Roseisolibacter sp. H3M3-2]MDF1501603.1 polymer-forming cytoskeletal protein [Roseisolibacter sp. H3M3-2]
MRRLRSWLALGAALLLGSPASTALSAQPAPRPAEGAVRVGALTVPAGTTTGGVVVLQGDVDVQGTVEGDVVALRGDVTVRSGARVTGNAVSVLGDVRVIPGGTVAGDAESFSQEPAWSRVGEGGAAATASPWRGLTLTLGWLAILLLIGIGVLVSGSTYLDGVADTLQRSVGRAIAAGLVGQLLVLPALVTMVLLLVVTVVGILAVPLAVVALILAVAGLLTLGFLAVSFVTGRAIAGAPGDWKATAARGEALRALTVGLLVYLALWIAAAALQGLPMVAFVVRVAALGLTWVAATAGFGAALLSRAGTHTGGTPAGGAGRRAVGTVPAERDGVPVWQTPTPIGGIVAARRPTAVPPPRD